MASELRLDRSAVSVLLTGEEGPVGRELAKRAVRVVTAAKRLCPVDTGRLRASIDWDMRRDSQGLFAIVGTDVEYAPHVELGTVHMAAQPFLRPALEAAR